jgi:hypothetical protein
MPTISAHVDEATAQAVLTAAKLSTEKKPGPWIGEAVRQRLERDGQLPCDPNAELITLAEALGHESACRALREKIRAIGVAA